MGYFISLFFFMCLSITAWANSVDKISLREKIGQMIIVGFDGKRVHPRSKIIHEIEENNIGGVILFDFNEHTQTFDKNITSPIQVKKLNNDLQYFTQQGNLRHHRPQLPLLITVDYEGGSVNRLGVQYGFSSIPSAASVGKNGSKKAGRSAELMAQTLVNMGFNLNFAPVLDVNVNPNNPIIGKRNRSFSKDPNKVLLYAGIYSQHFINHNIQCAYKHFPGHGSSNADSHQGFVDVTKTWHPYELIPYRQLLRSSHACGAIMMAHIINRRLDVSGVPATLSYKITTGILRNQLHFRGVIITDDMQMKAISEHYKLDDALVLAINAGADMFIFGNNLSAAVNSPKELIDIIEAKVLSGAISPKRIDEAYQHIVALKKTIKPH